MDEKVFIALITAIFVAYITHKFTRKRFKEELRIKKNEKNINDIKELINEFEIKLSERIFLTRGYMYDVLGGSCTDESREKYKKVILQWNIDFDYRSNRLSRFGFLSQIKDIDAMQAQLRNFHTFLVKCIENRDVYTNQDITDEIKRLKEFQSNAYKFITKLHRDADNQWDKIFNERVSFKRKIVEYCFDCFFKTTLTYVFIMLILFFSTIFFH